MKTVQVHLIIWTTLDQEEESKLCIEVHIIRFSATTIRNHSTILIKDNSNLTVNIHVNHQKIVILVFAAIAQKE